MGSLAGAQKRAASVAGVPFETYLTKRAAGEKFCLACRLWHPVSAFNSDRSRGDGLSTNCRASRSTGKPRGWHGRPPLNPLTGRPGPAPNPPRNGDRRQARQRVNVEVRTGRRPHPNTLPCIDCGHVWVPGERRHEYDHHLGYAAEHHLDVEPVCTTCHSKRDNVRAKATSCPHGHPFAPDAAARDGRGHRFCRACRRERDRKRGRDAAYWREYRARRAARSPNAAAPNSMEVTNAR